MEKKTKIIIGASICSVIAVSIVSLSIAHCTGLVELKNPLKKK